MNTQIKTKTILNILRIAMGWIFLWAFIDKLFGLGFATESSLAWIKGGSPTTGFLLHGTHGPLASIFQSLAGLPIVDWLFMLGLLCVGISMITKVYQRLGATVGIILMMLMYLAVTPPIHNPLIDEHIVYSLIFFLLANENDVN